MRYLLLLIGSVAFAQLPNNGIVIAPTLAQCPLSPPIGSLCSIYAGNVYSWNGTAYLLVGPGGGGGSGFNDITSGTNTSAAMIVGTGASLTVSGSGTITATAFAGVLPIVNGGTGQSTANGALNALLPSQATNAGKFLQTDGTNTSWATAGTGTVTSVTGTPPVNSSGGTTPAISIDTADTSTTGALTSTDWNTFNNKFTLPSLTAGSILFSDGVTIAQNNANFLFDTSLIRLDLGNPGAVSGDLQSRFRNQFTATDPTGSAVYNNNFNDLRFTFTDDSPANMLNNQSQLIVSIDAGKTVSGLAFNHYALLGRGDSADAGSLGMSGGYLASLTHGGNAAKHTSSWAAFQHSFDSIGSDGLVDDLYDVWAQASSPGAGGITRRHGIVLEPDANYTKDNWLSGTTVLGGVSGAPQTQTLHVFGKTYGNDTPGNDLDALGAEYVSSVNVTADASWQSVAVQATSNITVQSGATNSKVISAIASGANRGDGTDEGVLEGMAGIANFSNHNAGAAGVTNTAWGVLSFFNLQGGTVGDYYDIQSILSHSGGTISGTHYGIYLSPDNTNPVQNVLPNHLSVGFGPFTLAPTDVAFQIYGTGQITGANMDTATRDALAAVTSGLIYNTDTDQYEFYNGTVWAGMGGGSGATVALDNLVSTAVNADIVPDVDATHNLGSGALRWGTVYAAVLNTDSIGTPGGPSFIIPTTDGMTGQVLSTNGSATLSWVSRMATDMSNADAVTAIPSGTNLQFVSSGTGAISTISTKDVTGANSSDSLFAATGAVTDSGQTAGAVELLPGDGGAGAGGDVIGFGSAGAEYTGGVFWYGANAQAGSGLNGGDVDVAPGNGDGVGVPGQAHAPKGITLSTSGTQPTCDAAHRGLIWNVQGSTDSLQTCQNVASVYTWTNSLSRLFSHIADANNSGTGETDLYSDTTAANTFNANTEVLHAHYAGTFNDITATCQLKTYFGGTQAFDSGALTVSATGSFSIDMECIRETSSVVRCTTELTASGATASNPSQYTRITGLTLSGTNIWKITGQAGGVGGGSNDCTATLGYLEKK